MGFNYSCRLRLSFDSGKLAENAKNAVLPDLRSHKRSETEIKVNKDVLALNIGAVDAVALRASVNSTLKLIGLVQKISEVE